MLYYQSSFIPNQFIVIGTGGTGSRLVPLLSQFLKTLPWVINPTLTLIDFDVVEERNLVRQNFIRQDVGKNKAATLAARYSRHYELNIVPIIDKVVADKPYSLDHINGTSKMLHRLDRTVIFMCVDSLKAREEVLWHVLQSTGSFLVFDAGNEDDFGQITAFSSAGFSAVHPDQFSMLVAPGGKVPFESRLPFLPLDIPFYSSGRESEATGGCADLDQTLAINSLMAVNMLGMFQNFMYNKPMYYHRLNVSLSSGATPEYLTHRFLCSLNGVKRPTGTQGIAKALNVPRAMDPDTTRFSLWMFNEYAPRMIEYLDKEGVELPKDCLWERTQSIWPASRRERRGPITPEPLSDSETAQIGEEVNQAIGQMAQTIEQQAPRRPTEL